jgi:hypothetical protein
MRANHKILILEIFVVGVDIGRIAVEIEFQPLGAEVLRDSYAWASKQ